jgi:hypothetical protein
VGVFFIVEKKKKGNRKTEEGRGRERMWRS